MMDHPSRIVVLASFLALTIWSSQTQAQPREPTTRTGPAYVLVPKSAKRVKARLTLEVKGPVVQADEWSVYLCQMPDLPGQIDPKTTLFPQGRAAREMSDLGRPMLFVRIPSVGDLWRRDLTARAAYEATLLERKLERRERDALVPPAVAPLDPKTRRMELASTHHFDFQAQPFRAWLEANELRRKPMEDEVDFARRAFLVVRKGIKHFESEKAEHTASEVCQAGKSDYAGITALYVATLRANGIPTRALGGRVVMYDGKPARMSWHHARAEFYAQGIGWVPTDIAGAIRYNKSPEGLESFGNDPGDFLTMHLDTDLVLDTYFGPKTLEWLTDPSWWVLGSGSVDGIQTKVTVTVEIEPVDLAGLLAPQAFTPDLEKVGHEKLAVEPVNVPIVEPLFGVRELAPALFTVQSGSKLPHSKRVLDRDVSPIPSKNGLPPIAKP